MQAQLENAHMPKALGITLGYVGADVLVDAASGTFGAMAVQLGGGGGGGGGPGFGDKWALSTLSLGSGVVGEGAAGAGAGAAGAAANATTVVLSRSRACSARRPPLSRALVWAPPPPPLSSRPRCLRHEKSRPCLGRRPG